MRTHIKSRCLAELQTLFQSHQHRALSLLSGARNAIICQLSGISIHIRSIGALCAMCESHPWQLISRKAPAEIAEIDHSRQRVCVVLETELCFCQYVRDFFPPLTEQSMSSCTHARDVLQTRGRCLLQRMSRGIGNKTWNCNAN
jgi:hypothetical protein